MERIFSEWQNLAAGKTINQVLKQIGFYVIICCFFFAGNSFMFSDTEKRIKQGIPMISRYYDSLSFHLGREHVGVFCIMPQVKVKNCTSGNFYIMPVRAKSDIQFIPFNYYINYNNRLFLLDPSFDSIVSDGIKITSNFRQELINSIPSMEGIIFDKRTVLYYIACNDDQYRIAYYSDVGRIDESLETLPRDWLKRMVK